MTASPELPVRPAPEHLDVLIVGAGVSGIGAARHLQAAHPGRSYAILEARDDLGGTWDLFRYPGVRSDSDLHTFGYASKPWTGEQAIADGPAIKAYVREAATERGVDRHVRFGRRVRRAAWSSAEARWTVTVEDVATGETSQLTASWLFAATGYYRYDRGFTPPLPGLDRFRGPVVHPQHWPADLDHAGRRVLVLGSGATAVTLVPALARDAAHVTMLQRSPTYVLPVPSRDRVADLLRRVLGEAPAYRVVRRKNVARQRWLYGFCQRHPRGARRLIRWVNAKQLEGSGCDVDVHFNPRYDPWDQRLCAVPDGDLFRALRAGTASVVTGHVDTFTETGVRLTSGEELATDVVVTATGLELLPFGGIELEVDGAPVALPDTVAYKGLMLSGVPNLVFAIGYTNASWTLKVDLVCAYFCRLLAHLDRHGHDACVAEVTDPAMRRVPLLDFEAGYVRRALHELPKQGDHAPWQLAQDVGKDGRYLRRGPVDDAPMRFFAARRAAAVGAAA
jgi:cation diffusion facilitator CzcD-associated flavoprotein CzcO